MWAEIPRARVSLETILFRGVQAAFLRIGISPDFTNFWLKASLFRFWFAGLSKLGSSLSCILHLEKNQVARVLWVNSATCYKSVKLKFGAAWVQKDPANITTSAPVKI
jgi:hypothetical protein